MKLNHLRDVVAVADRGGLRAAARHLNLAQPALTRSLGEIERELDASLFERGARGTTLTATGQAFVARARSILNEVLPASDIVLVRRAGLPLPPAATALADLLRRAAAASVPAGHAPSQQAAPAFDGG